VNREQIKRRLAQLAELRKAAQRRVEDILNASLGEGRAQTDDEQTQIGEARAEVARIDTEVVSLTALDVELRDAEESEHPTATESGETGETRSEQAGQARQRGGAIVRREKRTYERHDMRTSYLRDLVAVQTNMGGAIAPDEARARLDRHAAEIRVELPRLERQIVARRGGYRSEIRDERADGRPGDPAEISYNADGPVGQEQRDLNRTDGTGGYFVPPVWLMQEFIDLSRGGRITADLCNQMPLPTGTDSINIPKVASGTTTATQTADNAAVSETDLTDTSVQANVKTIAGQQDLAMQLLDQSPLAFDQIVFADLTEDHAVKTDVQVINGSNASGQVRGILQIASVDTTAYTDGSPTVPELYPKLADSANVVASTRFRPVTAIIMHPRRWYWSLAAVDTASRPLVPIMAQGPQNALMAALDGNPAAEGGPVGVSPFGPIYIDPNIPTNVGAGTEDVIIETRPQELYLWESMIRSRVLTEVGSGTLTIRLQLYNYVAFMPHRRPESTSIVSGTGLAAPTF
jgi:HK97 family phage major capsid protein